MLGYQVCRPPSHAPQRQRKGSGSLAMGQATAALVPAFSSLPGLTNRALGLCTFTRASAVGQSPRLTGLISSHLTPGFSLIHLHFNCAICFLNKTSQCLVLCTQSAWSDFCLCGACKRLVVEEFFVYFFIYSC